MILSVSRRTDIPAFYGEWFFNRLQEGFILVRNPLNFHQVSKVLLAPELIDCIVFWTKNPDPMLSTLHLLADYHFYFQITINGYAHDIEPNTPPKSQVIQAFKNLSSEIGQARTIWRYDPIITTDELNVDFHVANFAYLAKELAGYTERCVISFLDLYKKTVRNTQGLGLTLITEESIGEIAGRISHIAREYGIAIETCSEETDLSSLGISHGKCVDDRLISRIIGRELKVSKDRNQRATCGCVTSVDIGAYNTCMHGCVYCYANYSAQRVTNNVKLHNPESPLLVGEIGPEDKIYERRI